MRKSGKTDYSNPSLFRPISLISHLGKVVERVIDRRLRSSDILDIDKQQFGFQPGKSTLHYLYKLYHNILAMKNLLIATVYDLEKAFDSVDQTLMLSKLMNSGLNGPMLATIKSFYRIGKSVSKSMIISTCHLSLLMVYLQDADLTYKYADDSTSVSSEENVSTSLKKAENYTYKWRQVLNKDKAEHKNFSKEIFQSDYKLVEKKNTGPIV